MLQNEKYLSVHVETTGLNEDLDKPICEGHDVVVVSLAVCDRKFNLLDQITVHFEQDRSQYGQEFHKITPAILEECGVSEEEGLLEICNFILDHFNPDERIVCIGQNVYSFTLPFLKQFLYKNEVHFQFSSNSIDVFSLTCPTIGPYTIFELIDIFGDVDELDIDDEESVKYLSLLKAITFISVVRKISKLWNELIE